MAVIDELRDAVSGMAGKVGASVVGVGHRWAMGSGVVVAPGRVLTNAHNLRGEEITVTFGDGRTATATPAGVDADGDVAVLEVDTGDAPVIDWTDGVEVGFGTPVFALANPGGRGLRVTFGMVSGTERSFRGPRGRRITGSVEHTAPLLPGSSGGPIVDDAGRLVGLNTNRLGEGFYLAIPADASLRKRADALARGESSARPRMGVGIAPPQVARELRRAVGLPDVEGLLIRVVEDDSPAAKAGLEEGDLITSLDGSAVAGVDDLHDALERAGKTLQLKVLRGAEERDVTVTLDA